jgi:hypothetical protein
LTTQHLEEAERLAHAILQALAQRAQQQTALAEATDALQRQFTLLEETYGRLRRAVRYLAKERVDVLTPSLYVGRGGRGSKERRR